MVSILYVKIIKGEKPRMNQSKKKSFIESITNVIVGYSINLLMQIIVFPIFGINIELHTNIYIGLCFTVVSILRSYTLRRIFNRLKND